MLSFVPAGVRAERLQTKHWKQGKVILQDGTVLKGGIRYDWRSEVVRFKGADQQQWAGSVRQIQEFSYFDQEEARIRRFVAMNFPVSPVSGRQLFMEVILDGTLSVYRRPHAHLYPRPFHSVAGYLFRGWLANDYRNFDYYVYRNASFTRLDVFSREFWPKLHQEMNEESWMFLTVNNLIAPKTIPGQLRLIARYNEIPRLAEPVHAE
ncbi:hypothetical protein [Arsenicibacter rosenii]|uniref:Uncharacterized protein n=1 Tax=Arsenicibacter rosenii TaxID=1750698 RepID=A0A1S2VJ43_9BACT|nr:hypothetical protein [Arsenicibacter rosenii]OIN58733.1 hypothetical protein BLX24_14360 [Arsenicibacter rosenii]